MIRAIQLLFGLVFMSAGGVLLYIRSSTYGGLFNPEQKEGLWIVVVGLILGLFGLLLLLMGLSRRARVSKIQGGLHPGIQEPRRTAADDQRGFDPVGRTDQNFDEGIIRKTVEAGAGLATGAAIAATAAQSFNSREPDDRAGADSDDLVIGDAAAIAPPEPPRQPAPQSASGDGLFRAPFATQAKETAQPAPEAGAQDDVFQIRDGDVPAPPAEARPADPMQEFARHVDADLQDHDIERIAEEIAPTETSPTESPTFEIPDLDAVPVMADLPELDVPSIDPPHVDAPEIEDISVETPVVPEIDPPVAEIAEPSIDLDISAPDVPELEAPVLETEIVETALPENDAPELAMPEVETPEPDAPAIEEPAGIEITPEPEAPTFEAVDLAEPVIDDGVTPEIELPVIDTPEIEAEPETPTVETPVIDTPDLPELDVPELDVPDLGLSDPPAAPEAPEIEAVEPDLDLPVIDTPEIDAEPEALDIDTPVIETPDLPDLDVPDLETPIIEEPGIDMPMPPAISEEAPIKPSVTERPDADDRFKREFDISDETTSDHVVSDEDLPPGNDVADTLESELAELLGTDLTQLPSEADDVAAPSEAGGVETIITTTAVAGVAAAVASAGHAASSAPEPAADMDMDLDAIADLPETADLDPVPEIDLPEISVPEIETPEIDAPEIDAPDMDVPELETPELDADDDGAPAELADDTAADDILLDMPSLGSDPETQVETAAEADAPAIPEAPEAAVVASTPDNYPRLEPVREAIRANDLEKADMLLASLRRDLISEGDENSPELAELTALAGDHAYAAGRVGGAKWLWRLARQRYEEAGAGESDWAFKVDDRLNALEDA